MADMLLGEALDFDTSFYHEEDQELTWKTKEGEEILVSKMKISHLNNCINMLKRRKQDTDFWIAVFEDELKERE